MNSVNIGNVKIKLVSYSEGDKVIDTETIGSFSKRGSLIKLEYEPTGDMPEGRTSVILSTEDRGKIKITRSGQSPIYISAENGEGVLEFGYSGYRITGKVDKVKTTILSDDTCKAKNEDCIFSLKLDYVMNAGGVKNKIKQTMSVCLAGDLKSEER